ncbi:hypothetical protein V1264_006598 [Littorina saxatilis]|uniref:Uncharacterized protein n=1 Tax=Littorina saxatilis TaxID=31220 RepID=A0AAN9AXI6_9CAEN
MTPKAEITTTEAPTPTTEAPTPTTEAPTPTTEAPTPTTEAQTPTTEASTPTPVALTPTTVALTPTTEAMTPTTESLTPTPEAQTPTTEAPTPTTEAPTPTTEALPPTTEALTPTPEALTPTTEAPTPTTEAPTPTTEALTPTTEALPPIPEALTPTTEAPTPTTEAMTPTTEAPTPTTEALPPTTEALTPITEALTPTPEALTPITEALTPTPEALTPTTEAPTPTTEAPTPTTEAPTPTTEALTPTTEAPTPTTEAQPTSTEAETTTAEAQTTTMGQQQPLDNTTSPGLLTRSTTIAALSDTTTMVMTTIKTMADVGSQVTQSVNDVTCNITLASECVSTAYQSLLSSLIYFLFNGDVDFLLYDVCRKYPSHRGCVKESLTACTAQERLLFDTGLSAFDFICTDVGATAVKTVLPCMGNTPVLQDLRGCSAQPNVNNSGLTACSVASNYADCVNQAFQQRCTGGVTAPVQDFLNATLRPLNSLYNCPALSFTMPPSTPSSDIANSIVQSSTLSSVVASTEPPTTTTVTVRETTSTATTTRPTTPSTTTTATTTTPPRPAFIQCYDCNSGNPGGWTNPDCTTSGDITPGIIATTSCKSPCFARVTRYPPGAVYRGCSEGWEYTFPDGFPKTGCHVGRNGETWCFCDADNCNNMDMIPVVNG